jgi:Tfp pilus assembly protein PilP
LPGGKSSKKVKVKSAYLMKENDLKERLFQFAIGVLKMLGTLKGGKEIDVIKYQLFESATSSGRGQLRGVSGCCIKS